jgi:excisionase family DNA binding protein
MSLETIPDRCQSVEAVAEYLDVAPLTVRRLIKRKKLKASRVGRRIKITPANLAKYLEENPA